MGIQVLSKISQVKIAINTWLFLYLLTLQMVPCIICKVKKHGLLYILLSGALPLLFDRASLPWQTHHAYRDMPWMLDNPKPALQLNCNAGLKEVLIAMRVWRRFKC